MRSVCAISLVLLCLLDGAAANCALSAGARQNLLEKLTNARGENSAGADYQKGASAATLYIYVETSQTTEEPGNDFGCKVSIHEYIHVLQQGLLTGQLTSLTPPADTLGASRFQIRNPASVPSVFGTKIKATLDALPSALKLLAVPTYVILIPGGVAGGVGSSVASAETDAVMSLQFPNNCAGVDFTFDWAQWENNPMAEGEAEYYAENVYMVSNSAVAGWAVPYDGAAMWAERMAENTQMLTTVGKQSLHLGDGMQPALDAMERAGWRANPIGELTYSYLKTTWRPATTHADLLQVWLLAPTAGSYAAAFATVMGSSWTKFVCDFEGYHGIANTNPSVATCVRASIPPLPERPPLPPQPPAPPMAPPGAGPLTRGGGDAVLAAGISIVGVIVLGVAGAAWWNWRQARAVEVKGTTIAAQPQVVDVAQA